MRTALVYWSMCDPKLMFDGGTHRRRGQLALGRSLVAAKTPAGSLPHWPAAEGLLLLDEVAVPSVPATRHLRRDRSCRRVARAGWYPGMDPQRRGP